MASNTVACVSQNASSGVAGRHFAPASLTRFGGFGELDQNPVWRRGDVDEDKFRQSRAQDRFVRRIREAMASAEMSEAELEARLGYKPRSLSRKFKGHELMTLRDTLRIGAEFGSSVMTALIEGDSNDLVVSERELPVGDVRNLLYEAAHDLDAAARAAEDCGDSRALTIARLAEVIAALADS